MRNKAKILLFVMIFVVIAPFAAADVCIVEGFVFDSSGAPVKDGVKVKITDSSGGWNSDLTATSPIGAGYYDVALNCMQGESTIKVFAWDNDAYGETTAAAGSGIVSIDITLSEPLDEDAKVIKTEHKNIEKVLFNDHQTILIQPGDEKFFDFKKDRYFIIFHSIFEDSANLIIPSAQVFMNLKEGDIFKVDIDKDLIYDLEINLLRLYGTGIKMDLKRIWEKIPLPERAEEKDISKEAEGVKIVEKESVLLESPKGLEQPMYKAVLIVLVLSCVAWFFIYLDERKKRKNIGKKG